MTRSLEDWYTYHKHLIEGTIPSFVDAILNIAESDTSSSLAHQDNWVYQLRDNGTNTINFFGDDTWIKLFPGLFTRTDGTTSFYVSVSPMRWKNGFSRMVKWISCGNLYRILYKWIQMLPGTYNQSLKSKTGPLLFFIILDSITLDILAVPQGKIST